MKRNRIRNNLGLGEPPRAAASAAAFKKAVKVLAGGVSSSARATTTGPLPFPLVIERGECGKIFDADGNQYVDFMLGNGSAILGHGNPELAEVLRAQLKIGTMFGSANSIEGALAAQIQKMVPSAKLVRLASTGSEAICGAVRAARGFTGRNKILKFEGHYHGWLDVLSISTRPQPDAWGELTAPASDVLTLGLPLSIANDVIVCPWNHPKILTNLLDKHDGEIAAIIAEPIVANNACIMPGRGFLQFLRRECTKRNIVLIFDEVCTGFRMGAGGAQALFGVESDLVVFSKALGGGLPIAAFGGRTDIMQKVAENTVRHGGTFNGNPLCSIAALHTLCVLARQNSQNHLRRVGTSIILALKQSSQKYGVKCILQGTETMFQIVFGLKTAAKHYRDLKDADIQKYSDFRYRLLTYGVHINQSHLACWFVSISHTAQDVAEAQVAIDLAMKSVA